MSRFMRPPSGRLGLLIPSALLLAGCASAIEPEGADRTEGGRAPAQTRPAEDAGAARGAASNGGGAAVTAGDAARADAGDPFESDAAGALRAAEQERPDGSFAPFAEASDGRAPDRPSDPGEADAGPAPGSTTVEPDAAAGRAEDAAPDAPPSPPREAGEEPVDAAAPREDSGDAGGTDAGQNAAEAAPVVPSEPQTLEEAGLYADFASRKLAPSTYPYQPAYTLWSDGAVKERYIYLPPGTHIDASDPDHWVFAVGTRLYKTFIVDGLPIETRIFKKQADGTWFRATYAWSEDGLSTSRVRDGVVDVFGTGYDIPKETACATCHDGAPDRVLGFETIGLANVGATGLTLSELNRLGLVEPPLTGAYTIPGDATTQAVLGYLHANCGNACHNGTPEAEAFASGFRTRLLVGALSRPEDTDTYETGIGVVSQFQPDSSGDWQRIAPGNPSRSTVPYRDGARGIWYQMPPIDTNVVDPTWLPVITAWIASLPRP